MTDAALRARQSAELRSTVRVYRKAWLFHSRHATGDECSEVASEFDGRLPEEDLDMRIDDTRAKPYEVWIRRWNLAGEFKYEKDASEFAEQFEDEVRIVDRNSREEHELLSYGKVKLPT